MLSKINMKLFGAFTMISCVMGQMSQQVSSNNTILQNLYALSMNQSLIGNTTSLSYISLLLGLNTSCTANFTQMLNSSEGNYTFFAPSDQAFRAIPGFPDFGGNFCDNCGSGGSGGSSGSSGGLLRSQIRSGLLGNDNCPRGCNDSSLAYNATSSQLMPCFPQMLQYHMLNESLYFNSTSFGFLNRSSFNLTVLPSMMNSSCLVSLTNSTGNSDSSGNYQLLAFNITNNNNNNSLNMNSNGGAGNMNNFTSNYNVTILHGINEPANVTMFDIVSSNGVLHVIDALLIPPANMSDTVNTTYSLLSDTNSTSNVFNQTDFEPYTNLTGITMFLPSNLTDGNANSSGTNSSDLLANYIFTELLYNNRSIEMIGNLSEGVYFQQNLTNLNGNNVTILFGSNNSMLFNGSQVVQSNILMKNGVLHLFNSSQSIFGGGGDGSNSSSNETSNNTGVMAGLGRILGHK